VSERARQLLLFYREQRIDDQIRFYTGRRDLFDRASGQALAVSAMLFGFAAAASALAGAAIGWKPLWTALAVIFPAMSTALAAYIALYAFEQQSKIYGDAVRAVRAASHPAPDSGVPGYGHAPEQHAAELVRRVEDALRNEQAQWGQLTSQIQLPSQGKS
jgi:hypothetical protein